MMFSKRIKCVVPGNPPSTDKDQSSLIPEAITPEIFVLQLDLLASCYPASSIMDSQSNTEAKRSDMNGQVPSQCKNALYQIIFNALRFLSSKRLFKEENEDCEE